MSRIRRSDFPTQKQPRGQAAEHSPDDRRHKHPAGEPGMDDARRSEKHHHKR